MHVSLFLDATPFTLWISSFSDKIFSNPNVLGTLHQSFSLSTKFHRIIKPFLLKNGFQEIKWLLLEKHLGVDVEIGNRLCGYSTGEQIGSGLNVTLQNQCADSEAEFKMLI